jgi:hypothetical protein
MYVKATSRDHGFLYCNLMQSDPAKMFYSSFNARLVPNIDNQLTNSSGSADGIE